MTRKELRRAPGGSSHWLALFVLARVGAALVAAVLLLAHRITEHDGVLIAVVAGYAMLSVTVARRWGARRWIPLAWGADAVATLALVLAAGDWRSPFYLLALTSLILPATSLARGRAIAATIGFTAGYFSIAVTTGVDWDTLESTSRLESFATHLLLPMVLGVGLAYAAALLRRLDDERRRSERLVLEAERRRIARELHDSAKQRIHAARLVLSSERSRSGWHAEDVAMALRELDAAMTEMDESLTDLRTGPGSAGLVPALRGRADRLAATTGIRVEVQAEPVEVAAPVATHVYYLVCEAMVNAVRHAAAREVRMSLAIERGCLVASVADDGRGLPAGASWASHGLRSMVERAELIGGRLVMGEAGPAGTRVRLEVPLERSG